MQERTLLIVKPDAVKKNVSGEILRRGESAGLKIVAAKMIALSKAHDLLTMRRWSGAGLHEVLGQQLQTCADEDPRDPAQATSPRATRMTLPATSTQIAAPSGSAWMYRHDGRLTSYPCCTRASTRSVPK